MIEKFFKGKGLISQFDFCQANGLSISEFTHMAKQWIQSEFNFTIPQPKTLKRISYNHPPYCITNIQ